MGEAWGSITTTASTAAPGLLLHVSIDGGNYFVCDFIGARYGHAASLKDALTEWIEQVNDILALDEPLGDPLKSEVAAYKKALPL